MATPRQPPQTIAFVPQGTNQAKGSRSLPLGALVEVTNGRQVKEDEWRKRRGFARTVPAVETVLYGDDSFGGAIHAGRRVKAPAVYGGASPGDSVYAGSIVERDAVGQFWSLDPTNSTRRFRGVIGDGQNTQSGTRPFPSYRNVIHDLALGAATSLGVYGPRRSVTAIGANNDIWTFTVGKDQFTYSIAAADGAVKLSQIARGIANAQQLTAVYNPVNSTMWVLILNEAGTTVSSMSFNVAGVLQVFATYASPVGATSLKAYWLSSPQQIAVVIAAYDNATPRCRVTQSYLDTVSGLPKGAPAPVNFDSTPNANRPRTCGGVNILIGTGATSWYYSFWRAGAAQWTVELVLVTVTTATLATASSTVLTTVTTPSAITEYRGVTSGYVDTVNGNRVVFGQSFINDTLFQPTYHTSTGKYVWNGTVTTEDPLWALGAWLASDPVLVGGAWYVATGWEGGNNSGFLAPPTSPPVGRIGRLFLRDTDGNIVSQALSENAPCMWQTTTSINNDTSTAQLAQYDQFVTTLLSPAANKIIMVSGVLGEVQLQAGVVSITWDFAAQFGPPVALADLAVFPGPILTVVGASEHVREAFPLHPPPALRAALGTTGLSGTASACATYRFMGADGKAWESAPSLASTGTFFADNNGVTIPSLKHIAGAQAAEMCLYSTPLGSSIYVLQKVFPNNPLNTSVASNIWPSLDPDLPGLTPLPTSGGGLSNASPPPSRNVALWHDRLHLSGTPTEGEVWHSQEIVEGFPPTFSEILRSNWNDGQGGILGMKAVDWNYLAAWKRNGVGVISGPGPDGRGNQGAYVWQTLTTEKGLSDTGLNSLLSTPFGAAFQNEADGRICLVSTGLQIQDLMQGADASRTLLVGACLLHEGERQAWFYCTDGTLLVLEYAWAGETKGLVNCWRRWATASLLRAYGAVITPAGPLHIESTGVLRTQRDPASTDFTDASPSVASEILTAYETGRLAPFGLMQEGGVVGAHVLGQHLGVTSMRITVTCDDGTPSVHDKTTSSPVDYSCKPTGGFRSKEVRVRIEETASGGTEGYVFEGVALDVVPYGRTRILAVSQRIA